MLFINRIVCAGKNENKQNAIVLKLWNIMYLLLLFNLSTASLKTLM